MKYDAGDILKYKGKGGGFSGDLFRVVKVEPHRFSNGGYVLFHTPKGDFYHGQSRNFVENQLYFELYRNAQRVRW